WIEMVETAKNLSDSVRIAMVGKYTALHDSYISVVEALKHGGIGNKVDVDIKWVESDTINENNVFDILGDVDGILVPGGFGDRGIEGMIIAANYARTNTIPYLGICLGMQIAMIEFARNVLGFRDANSVEFDPDSNHPVIDLMPEQREVKDRGASMRLGKCSCRLKPGTKVAACYGSELIEERHRHRYEVNNLYRAEYEANGLVVAGQSPDGRIVEMIELPEHLWYVACQFHPEFKSRPNRPHPLFKSFVEAAKIHKDQSEK
ncbi:MAG: CTP synthase, partial [Clostridia bacterium]|nr:CTP synthase [Clostridia bacterium]